mgnify:CR=1 FL=1
MGEIVSVNFRGDELYGFKQDDGVFVALKPICEAMGLAWEGQRQRVNRDPVLSEGTSIMQVPFGRHGGQEVTCLKMDLLNGWLFGIDSSRIRDEAVRERVILYQRECYGVLYRHFSKGRLERLGASEADLSLPLNDRRKLVVEARQTFGHVVAKELWISLGMPTVDSMFLGEAVSDQPDLPGLEHANDRGDEYKAA